MEIKSDNNTFSSETPTFKTLSVIHSIISSIISLLLIAMSTNNLEPSIIIVSSFMLINVVLYNMIQTHQTLEVAQQIEDDAMGYILTKKPISGPIGLVLSIVTLGFLVTGNLFGWQMYIVYIIIASLIAKSHKSRIGVIPKEKKS